MEIGNGIKYESNYARAASSFLGTCAPAPQGAERMAAYRFLTKLYTVIAEHAEDIGWKPTADVYFEPWEQQNTRQNDVKIIRTSIDKIDVLIAELYALVLSGTPCSGGLALPETVKPGRTLQKLLSAADSPYQNGVVALPDGCAAGLRALAEISGKHVVPITDAPKADKAHFLFSRCVFEPDENWISTAIDHLLGADGSLLWLCGELERRGYTRLDCKDGKRISLDYVKAYGKKSEPVKMSWADKFHAGIEVTFEDLRLEPYFVWLRIPQFKTVLENLAALPAETAAFITSHTKTCNGCRYCVQTDKTGTRPLAAIEAGGKKKCPYYPAFTMNWRELPRELAEKMLATLDAVDALLNHR